MTIDLKSYGLVVIGGGPAGIIATTVASSFRKSVALVDSHQEIGGAGINTGTVPSKTLRETALALSGLKSRNLFGVDLSLITWFILRPPRPERYELRPLFREDSEVPQLLA
jgi:pyruvate/2-oxoglutarate dehydrogenase complex dihydrolipoamide dehydrogenase (E3) component